MGGVTEGEAEPADVWGWSQAWGSEKPRWPRSHFSTLSLSFLISPMGTIVPTLKGSEHLGEKVPKGLTRGSAPTRPRGRGGVSAIQGTEAQGGREVSRPGLGPPAGVGTTPGQLPRIRGFGSALISGL